MSLPDEKSQSLLSRIFAFILSFAILYGCLSLGRYISQFLPFVFPGSIIGMLILFLLLELKILRMHWITPCADVLMRHMVFLFIPAAVGMVAYLNEVFDSVMVIIFNVLSGIALIILIVGRLFQHFTENKEQREQRHELYKRASNIRKLKRRGA